jgi:hypothetical protein
MIRITGIDLQSTLNLLNGWKDCGARILEQDVVKLETRAESVSDLAIDRILLCIHARLLISKF